MPKWVKYALIGAISAVVVDYYVNPTLNKML